MPPAGAMGGRPRGEGLLLNAIPAAMAARMERGPCMSNGRVVSLRWLLVLFVDCYFVRRVRRYGSCVRGRASPSTASGGSTARRPCRRLPRAHHNGPSASAYVSLWAHLPVCGRAHICLFPWGRRSLWHATPARCMQGSAAPLPAPLPRFSSLHPPPRCTFLAAVNSRTRASTRSRLARTRPVGHKPRHLPPWRDVLSRTYTRRPCGLRRTRSTCTWPFPSSPRSCTAGPSP